MIPCGWKLPLQHDPLNGAIMHQNEKTGEIKGHGCLAAGEQSQIVALHDLLQCCLQTAIRASWLSLGWDMCMLLTARQG